MNPEKVKEITIITVDGSEFTFTGNRADDLFKAYKGAVENSADWIYSENDAATSVFQIQHIVNIHVVKEVDSNA